MAVESRLASIVKIHQSSVNQPDGCRREERTYSGVRNEGHVRQRGVCRLRRRGMSRVRGRHPWRNEGGLGYVGEEV